jgi:hypothetical protein
MNKASFRRRVRLPDEIRELRLQDPVEELFGILVSPVTVPRDVLLDVLPHQSFVLSQYPLPTLEPVTNVVERFGVERIPVVVRVEPCSEHSDDSPIALLAVTTVVGDYVATRAEFEVRFFVTNVICNRVESLLSSEPVPVVMTSRPRPANVLVDVGA